MPLPDIEEIIGKYKQEEDKIDKALVQRVSRQEPSTNVCKTTLDRHQTAKNLEEARTRNQGILRDLETVKATLRSRAIFSPTEMQWETICKRYKDEPALPVTTWKCHLPIYV